MDFKNWLFVESEKIQFLSWDADGAHRGWYVSSLGHRPTFQAYIDPKNVSIEYAGPRHPLLKRALTRLVRQLRGTGIEDKKFNVDGWSPGTVNDFLSSPDVNGPKDRLPKYLWHGTSLFRWERIREEGLLPLGESGAERAYGAKISSAKPADPKYVYMATTLGSAVRMAAQDAQISDEDSNSIPIILRINTSNLDYNKLRPDIDSRTGNWLDSMHIMDAIAYEGKIAPQDIELHKAWDKEKKKFVDPRPDLIEPQDWLAQQMLHRTGYQTIPGTKSQFKWAN